MADCPTQLAEAGLRAWPRTLSFMVGVGALVGLVDQCTKTLAVLHLGDGMPHTLVNHVVSLTLYYNQGTAMGLIPLHGTPLAVVAVIFVLAVLVWGQGYARASRPVAWGLALLLGGAVGNLLDRVRLGYVVDFIDFHFWPVFNIADCAVVVGAALILIVVLLHARCTDPEAPKDPV